MMRKLVTLLTLVAILSMLSVSMVGAAPAQSDTTQTYVVLYKSQSVPSDASSSIAAAGGSLVYSYNQIGVAIAQSNSASFSANLSLNAKVEGVSSTAEFAVQVTDQFEVVDAVTIAQTVAAGSWGDPMSNRQWDMYQIHVPEAYAINQGSPSVVVGDIDTGLDYTHPDLAANVDFANSVSCVSGVPDTNPAAWMDDNGHGTHTAGTIAAAQNGVGIVGVAPNVKIAGIKAGNAEAISSRKQSSALSCGRGTTISM
jgi:subtilisin family serine protease